MGQCLDRRCLSKRNNINAYPHVQAGQRSRYRDWLRAGRARDRIPVRERFSAPVQTGPGVHPASCTMGTESFPGVKSGRGVTLTLHPLVSAVVMKGQSYTSTPPMGCTACTEPQCLYKGAFYLYLTYPHVHCSVYDVEDTDFPCTCHKRTEGGEEVQLHSFLSLAL